MDFVLNAGLPEARFMRYESWASILDIRLFFLKERKRAMSSFSRDLPFHWFAFFVKIWIAVQESAIRHEINHALGNQARYAPTQRPCHNPYEVQKIAPANFVEALEREKPNEDW